MFRKLAKEAGLWDQIQVDCGREWYLMLFAQKCLLQHRNDVLKAHFRRTSSKRVNLHKHNPIFLNITFTANIIM